MEPRKDAVGSQRAMYGPSNSASTSSQVPEYPISGGVKPVLNYSIQTGEEFAFMRDQAISKKNLVPGTSGDQNVATGYMNLRGILGGCHTGSEGGSDVSMVMAADSRQPKEVGRKLAAENENRSQHMSTRSVPRASSGDGSSRGLSHGYASSEASDTSRRIKFLCSFGGKILPRPSDGKLRYVGGETRIIRINRDVSWQELRQKTTAIYNQPHVIKYQLPGEDLDALISVSSDEDLRNMMEEYGMLESGEGSPKLRIFLFSSIDFDDMSFSLGSMDGDSEIQYVVAINGMNVGAGKPSSGHGLASASGSELDQFINLNIDNNQANTSRERSDLHGMHALSSVPSAILTPTPASLSSDYAANSHSYQGHGMRYAQGSNNPFPATSERLYDAGSRISMPLSVPSDYGYTSQYAPYSGTASVSTSDRQSYLEGMMEGSMKDAKTFDKMPLPKNEVDYFQSIEHLGAPLPPHDPSVSNYMNQEAPPVTSAQECLTPFLQPSGSGKSIETCVVSKAMSATQGSELNEEDHHSSGGAFASGYSDFEGDMTDHGFKNAPPRPGRVFHSERIPREQAEFLNRLSKSDDSLGSQLLILQSQSGVANESIAEAVDPASEGVEKSDLTTQPLNLNNPAIDDGLIKFEKEFASAAPRTSQVSMIIPSEESDAKRISEHPVFVDQQVNEKRTSSDANSRNTEKISHAAEKAVPKGKLKEATVNGVQTNKQQGSDAAVPRRVSWEAPKAALPADVEHDPAVMWSTTSATVPKEEPLVPNTQNRDISVDINDRFPPDVLSDFFAKAKAAAQSSIPFDDPVPSLNMANYEPQRWSFFRNLAKNEFPRKDDDKALAKIEEGIYPFADVEHEAIKTKNLNPQMNFDAETKQEPVSTNVDSSTLPPSYISSNVDHQPIVEKSDEGFQAEGFQVDNPFAHIGENMRPPVSEIEEQKFEEGRTAGPVVDVSLRDIDFEHLQIIKNEDLEELRELGSGTFGTVYHGKWRGTDVAIKRIKKSCFTGRSSEQERLVILSPTCEQERLAREFWREAEILSKLHHPNVVAFYGVVRDGPGGTLATVTEFMVNGSLRHVLQRKDKYLDRRKRLIIAMDAAFGMEYLHSKNIVHFDLKCDNLLVNLKDQSRPICKVGDFGLSKIKRNTLVTGGVRGTLPWMAPELLNGSSNKVSEKVDVFSFGIVMWEILTGEEPYANMHYGAIIGGIVNNTLRPPVPSTCDPDWRRLMEQCWAPDPVMRPAFTEIAGRLRSMSTAANQAKTATK